MENPVLIIGTGRIGKLALDIFNKNNVLVYGFLTDDKTLIQQEIGEVVVLGNSEDDNFLKIIGNKTEVFVAEDSVRIKQKLVKQILEDRKTMPVNCIHDKASVSEEAEIGHGIMVGANASVGPFSKIGNHSIIHAGAHVDAEVNLGEFVEIGMGAIVNHGVILEEGVFVGAGAVLVSGIKIGKNARIGAGSVVIANVESKKTVFGNPAAEFEA